MSSGEVVGPPTYVRVPSVGICLVTIFRLKLLLSLQGLGPALAWVRGHVGHAPSPIVPDPESLRACERRLASVAALYPGRVLCLEQSLALYCLLRRKGIALTFVLGVRPSPFAAHAWVEQYGIPINDVDEHVRWYTRLPGMLP
ncbi:MAG: lasso peptide biosynthesis B2 protein [Gemmatimonadales bacterium]